MIGKRLSAPTCSRGTARIDNLEPRVLLSASFHHGVWKLIGPDAPANPDDVIVVDRADDGTLTARINGEAVGTLPEAQVRAIRVRGGRGDDEIRLNLGADSPIRVLIRGGAGNDRIYGSVLADRIYGDAGDDLIRGGDGADWISGGRGDDDLEGDGDKDRLYGGPGNDIIRDSEGVDLLRAGKGLNTFVGLPAPTTRPGRHDRFIDQRPEVGPLDLTESQAQFKQWLIDAAVARYQDILGTPYIIVPYWDICYALDTPTARAAFSLAGDGAASGHSDTNVQVVGVDEGDLVKTDGEFLYSIVENGVAVLDVWPPEQMSQVASLSVEGTPQALYLYGNRLTIISSIYGWSRQPVFAEANGLRFMPVDMGEYRQEVKVTVLDVTDPTSPVTAEETYFDGWLMGSRAIDDRVYLAVNAGLNLPAPSPVGEGEDRRYQTEAEYRAYLDDYLTPERLPAYHKIVDTPDGQQRVAVPLGEGGRLYTPASCDSDNLMSVVMLDVDDGQADPVAMSSVAGVSGQIYVSAESLYVVSQHQQWLRPVITPRMMMGRVVTLGGDWNSVEQTDIYKFSLGADDVPLVATGAVSGHVLNQFSMDEHEGYFRIATTEGWSGERNSVHILGQQGDQLETVGSLTDLGLDEKIYSARFMGDRGFLVTFRKTDPLWTLDLSDPTNPRVVGELEVPGFSSYLHPIDENHIIGIGRYVDPSGRLFGGLQLSLFDVTDFANPVRTDVIALGDGERGDWSEAQYDHHAFSYFAEYSILAVPVQSDWNAPTGLEVFRVDTTDGFELLGEVTAGDGIRRSLRIGEYLYAVSASEVKAVALTDPTQVVGTAAVTAPPQLVML